MTTRTYRIYITYTTWSDYYNAWAEAKTMIERRKRITPNGAKRIVRKQLANDDGSKPNVNVINVEHFLYS